MAHILIASQFFPPETGAGARRVGAFAAALSSRHDVSVLTLQPGYPSPDLFEGMDINHMDDTRRFNILRPFSFHPYRGSLIHRGLAEIGMASRLALKGARMSADVVLVSTPSMFLAPAFFILAKVLRARFVWDLRDFTWVYARETGGAAGLRARLTRVIERLMTSILRSSDRVVTTNEGATRLLMEEYGLAPHCMMTYPNGISRTFFDSLEVQWSLNSPVTVLYLGLLGHNHGLEVLVRAAQKVPEAQFVIVGDGPERPRIEAMIEELGVSNVEMVGYQVSQESIIGYYRSADILINHTRDTPVLNRGVLPAKIFEYMATGRPIISSGRGVTGELLRAADCALIVPPEDPAAMADAIHQLISDPGIAQALGRRAREHVRRQYLREDLAEAFTDELSAWLSND